MRTEVAQGLAKGLLGVDTMVNTANATALELAHGQLGFSRDVLDDQYAQVQWHPVLRGRSRHHPPRREGKLASSQESANSPARGLRGEYVSSDDAGLFLA